MSKIEISVESIQEIVAQAVAAVLAQQGFLPQAVAKADRTEKAAERDAHKAGNKAAAAWMREKGLVPSGQAWTAVKNGERNVTKLRKLNAADGQTPKAEKPEAVETEVAPK